MVRTLLVIFFVGLLVSAAGFAGAAALGGVRDWPHQFSGVGKSWSKGDGKVWLEQPGPTATRNAAWADSDELVVNVPAKITYIQAAEPGLVITGPKNWIDKIEVEGKTVSLPGYRPRDWTGPKVDVLITVKSPNIRRFELNGAQTLVMSDIKQDELEISVSGAGTVRGSGEVRRLNVKLAGAGDVSFGAMRVKELEAEFAGAGSGIFTPSQSARIRIAGVGSVELLTRPVTLETDIAGAGRVKVPDNTSDQPPPVRARVKVRVGPATTT